MKQGLYLTLVLFVSACGNSNDLEIMAPGATGNLEIISLGNSNIVFKSRIENGMLSVGVTEFSADGEPIQIEVENSNSAILTLEDQNRSAVHVDAITTLASCRLQSQKSKNLDRSVKEQNDLIARQFLFSNLQDVSPDLNYDQIQNLKESSAYGILLGGFDHLSQTLGISTSGLVELLCRDVAFDGVFNGIDRSGKMNKIDDQTLKLKLAQSVYAFAKKKLTFFNDLPIRSMANEISLSNATGLFDATTMNYSFDQ